MPDSLPHFGLDPEVRKRLLEDLRDPSIVSRLPERFQLIAEWTRHMRLEEVLNLTKSALSRMFRKKPRNINPPPNQWNDEFLPILSPDESIRAIIPTDLWDATWRFLDSKRAQRRRTPPQSQDSIENVFLEPDGNGTSIEDIILALQRAKDSGS